MADGGPSLRKRLRRARRRATKQLRKRLRKDVAPVLARILSVIPRSVPLTDRARRFVLERAWSGVPSKRLDSYLVSGYQNPRINLQSVLLRHALIRRMFGGAFGDLMAGEIRHAVELNDALRLRALELDVTMGSYLDREKAEGVRRVDEILAGRDLEFAVRWTEALSGRRAGPLSVLEFACGSANDYRAFADYGIAPFLAYRGVDLTATNIANARERFPGVDFEVRSVLELPYPDASFDCVIASDLFEHLPPEDMPRALDAACRIARSMVVLNFFAMADIDDHVVSPTGVYHWNRLSRSRVEARLRDRFGTVTVIPVAPWVAEHHGYAHSYNPGAWTIIGAD